MCLIFASDFVGNICTPLVPITEKASTQRILGAQSLRHNYIGLKTLNSKIHAENNSE